MEEESEQIPENPLKKQKPKPEETKPKINIFETIIDSKSSHPPEESNIP